MKKHSLLVVVGAVITTCVGVIILFRSTARSDSLIGKPGDVHREDKVVNESRDNRALDEEVATLRRQVNLLTAEKAHASAVSRPASETSPRPKSLAELNEYNERADQKYLRQVDAFFANQPRDAEWAPKIERAAEGIIKKIPDIATFQEVRCAQSICRVVVNHKETADRIKLNRAVSTEEPFAFGTYYSYDGLVTTMYVMREGHRMPSVEP
jgi:hypothetical protein